MQRVLFAGMFALLSLGVIGCGGKEAPKTNGATAEEGDNGEEMGAPDFEAPPLDAPAPDTDKDAPTPDEPSDADKTSAAPGKARPSVLLKIAGEALWSSVEDTVSGGQAALEGPPVPQLRDLAKEN